MTPPSSATKPTSAKTRPSRDPATVLAASTFAAGLRLLPKSLQKDSRNLYYLLRSIDDLVDERAPEARARVEAIERWTEGEKIETPETTLLERLAQRHHIPPDALRDFCRGMRCDLDETPVQTEADLERYAHDVAGTVGIMLAQLLGTTHPDGTRYMELLGRAMQRTNILRDIDEDQANGRLYIPHTAIEQHGTPTPGNRKPLLLEQIARADTLYEQGMHAIPLLRHGQDAMAVSAKLYREILRQIERDGFGQTARRSTVPAWRKHTILIEHQLHTRKARPSQSSAIADS